MNQPHYTMTHDNITVVWEGKSHSVRKGAPNFQALRDTIMKEKWEDIPSHLTVQKSIKEWAKGKFQVSEDGQRFKYGESDLPGDINRRIVEMATKGEDPSPLFKFWERLQKNPSYRSVEQLFQFLQHRGIPITEDGCFLAYKGVRSDFKDAHSGSFDNSPGAVNEMPRNQVSDDPKTACHEGFHVGELSYASSFSQRVVVCKVDPEHVVSVPYDSSEQKMRVCKYKVIGNHNGELLPSTTIPETDERETETEEFDGAPEEVEEKGEKVKKPKPAKARKTHKFDKLGLSELLKESIEDLRKYAGKALQIVGASKIPGGKVALVDKILETRE